MKKNKKSKLKLGDIISIVLLVGIGVAFAALGLLDGSSDNSNGIFREMIILFVTVFISMYINIIIHEGGHLIFGLLTGYKFLSFRVGTLTLIKEEKFKFKKFNILGTGGQCLMEPPEYDEDNFPYFLYNLGGGALNLITSIILIIIAKNIQNNALKEILIVFSVIGIFVGLSNLIPLKLGGINNDGMNIVYLKKSKEARFSLYLQLKIETLLIKGKRFKDMPYDWFNLPENLDLKNSINLSRKVLEGNYYLDKKDFNKAKEIYNEILEDEDILTFYKLELPCEIIFCELMTEGNKEKIDELYTKQLQKYIAKSSIMISKLRLQYAYYRLFEKNFEKAAKIKEKFNKTLKTYPSKGEILAEQEFMKIIDEKII